MRDARAGGRERGGGREAAYSQSEGAPVVSNEKLAFDSSYPIRPRGRFRFVRVTTVLPVHPVVDRGSGVRDERGPGAISRFANREKSRSDAARRRSIFGSDAGASTRSNPRFWVHGSDSEKASRCNIHDRRQVGPRGYMFDPARATAIQHDAHWLPSPGTRPPRRTVFRAKS